MPAAAAGLNVRSVSYAPPVGTVRPAQVAVSASGALGGPGPHAPAPLFTVPPSPAGPSVFPAMVGWGGAADRPPGGLALVLRHPFSPTPPAQSGPVVFLPWRGRGGGGKLPSLQGLVRPASTPGGLARVLLHPSLPPLLAHVAPAIFPPLGWQAQIQKVLPWWVIAPGGSLL